MAQQAEAQVCMWLMKSDCSMMSILWRNSFLITLATAMLSFPSLLTSVNPTEGLLHKVAKNAFLSLLLMSSEKTSPSELMMTVELEVAVDAFHPYRGAMILSH